MSLRPHLVLVAMAAGAPLAGCGDSGEYSLSWRFSDQDPAALTTARDCGLHGVEAFAIAGSNEGGDDDTGIEPCGQLAVTRVVPTGHWTMTVVALDRRGKVKEPGANTILRANPTFDVKAGAAPTPVELTFVPQPQCRDGVDNDLDGAVDGADGDCKDPETASE